MLYIIIFVGVFLVLIATLLLMQKRPGNEKATLARIDTLMQGAEQIGHDDPILLEIGKKESWLETLIGQTSIVKYVDTLLNQAAWTVSAQTFLLWCVGAGFAGYVAAWLFLPGVFYEFAVFTGCAFIPYLFLKYSRTKRLKAFNKALPDAIDIMQRTLRAGLALNEAFKRAAEKSRKPVSSEFHTVVVRMQRGADMRAEMVKLADRVPTSDLRIFITALLVQKETGGDLPVVLERMTDMIRTRTSLQEEMKAETAQGRLSGLFLTLIPVVMLVALKVISPAYLEPMLQDPRGRYMLLYCVISDLIGAFFIRRITMMEV